MSEDLSKENAELKHQNWQLQQQVDRLTERILEKSNEINRLNQRFHEINTNILTALKLSKEVWQNDLSKIKI